MNGDAAHRLASQVQAGQREDNLSRSSTISLPKGGGAIRGIGEKFSVNPVTGTGSLTLPIFCSSGRSDFSPQLTLSYDSGNGNGPFALGWHLSLPSIARKTDKGLPRYDDAAESDVFLLSNAEDLVPVLDRDGNQWGPLLVPDATVNGQTYTIRRYRPRIEGLFARIERWRRQSDGDTHWRATTKDNVTSLYGQDPKCRIADPADPSRVFKWLLETTFDDKGNVILYEYKPEDATGINSAAANERNRQNGAAPFTNLYIKRIYYGTQTPYQREEDLPKRSDWLFEVVFDYGEHDPVKPAPAEDPARKWNTRADPFSNFRSTFEIRTYRLCRRVLMFHHFPKGANGESGYEGLVRSTDFAYDQQDPQSQLIGNTVGTKLVSVTQTGYNWDATGKSYLSNSFPPLEFTYSEAKIDPTVRTIEPESLENLPAGADDSSYRWLDLDGEGLSGILTEQAGAIFYKRNLSPINTVTEEGAIQTLPRFAPIELLASQPGSVQAGPKAQFMDLAADGHQDMVSLEGPLRGYYERTDLPGWESFRTFESFPNLDTRDPNLKFIDIDGDGLADILVSEDEVMSWYLSLGQSGFGLRQYARKPIDEEQGPALAFSDTTQSIFLADMSGDGLTDILRIRNGEVCYWPNLGYGRFGPKVAMDGSPCFDTSELFDARRIRLGDIDGSGTTDILYLGEDDVAIYFNQSGNSLAEKKLLPGGFPATNNLSSVSLFDLLGQGTACLVWSSQLPSDNDRQMQYVDLMSGQKPHLLIGLKNNLGAETRVRYAPSTKFYVQDREAGTPWVTRLAFPVHVAERVEVFDHIGRTRLVSTYRYRHGYFDGVEREFRGFGYVEQRDAESFGDAGSLFTEDTDSEADALHVPPVVTKTWFHTGAWPDEETIIHHMARDYFDAPSETDPQFEQKWEIFLATLLPNTILPTDIVQADDTRLPYALTEEEEREAVRALKGCILRQEIYAADGTDKAQLPYSVSQRNYTIECFQPQAANRYAVFFTHARESIGHQYERNLADPRVAHTAVLKADTFGNVLQSISVAYGRNLNLPGIQIAAPAAPGTPPDLTVDPSAFAQSEQATALITLNQNEFTGAIDQPDAYRAPAPAETLSYELTRPPRPDDSVLYFYADLQNLANTAVQISYETVPDLTLIQKRLLEDVRILYLKDDLSGPLPPAQSGSLGLVYETYKLAFTANLAEQVFIGGNSNPNKPADAASLNSILAREACYVNSQGDGNWWVPSGQMIYSPVPADPPDPFVQDATFAAANFYLPQAQRDPFGQYTRLTSDSYKLLLAQTQDALGNTISAQNEYRVLQPAEVIDPNQNHIEIAFDVLGLVVGTAVKGKVGTPGTSESGDSFVQFTTDLAESDIDGFINNANPLTPAPGLLGTATTRIVYDLERFSETQAANPADPTQWQPIFSATIVRETHVSDLADGQQSIVQASFSYSDGLGREIQKKVQAEPGPLDLTNPQAPVTNPRWIGSGWTILNNKGKPVREYEPFFSATHDFEFANKVGVTPTLFYDPLERVVATLHPNHTWEKVGFDPWRQKTWDLNDTVTFDPKTDPDVGDLFSLLPDPDYLPTWYQLRTDPAMAAAAFTDANVRSAELDAANKTALHNDTPTAVLFDVLGRPFLSVTHNRFQKESANVDEFHATRTALDIESNQVSVTDALGRTVAHYDYNVRKHRIHQASMEAGERWILSDVIGKPLYGWDSRNHRFRTTYDLIRRPTDSFLRDGVSSEILVAATIYGENRPNPEANNLRGKAVELHDQAGLLTSGEYDFKSNLLTSSRQLLQNYQDETDWSQSPALEAETFTSSTTYDALNRPTSVTSPDHSIHRPTFNEANLLENLAVQLTGAIEWTSFVTHIDYNAKGQRNQIQYGNGASATYDYDPQTFRLTQLRTTRPHGLNGVPSQLLQDPGVVQDLNYTYDPSGNITRIRNEALLVLYYNNEQIEPTSDYTYDAIYRLFAATGREHIGQTTFAPEPQTGNLRDYPFLGIAASANDSQSMRNYTERYDYDAAGNFEAMIHVARNANWTRHYNYNEASLLEPVRVSNRLSSTQVGDSAAQSYSHDIHGNLVEMPHLPMMQWDFKDQLHATQQQVVNNAEGKSTYYVYDVSGQRLRKVTESAHGTKRKERTYLGGFEVYREYDANGVATLVRQTLHVMDDKQRIALVETGRQGNGSLPTQLVRYQLGNHLGSASLELDEVGQIISYEEYYPYGGTSYQAGRSLAEVSLKRYRYTGEERDEESGLDYHAARYYAPWLARWTAADPIGIAAGINLFRYVSNNPVIRCDPTGADEVTIYHRTTEEGAASMTQTGVKLDMSRPHVWAGGGFYGLDQPSIPGSGASGDVIVAQKINADAVVDLSNAKGIGSNIAEALQETDKGRKVRSEIYRQMYDEGDTQARILGWKPSNAQMDKYFRDYMDRQISKIAPNAGAIKWRNVDGTYTYVVKKSAALVETPTIAGKMVNGRFVKTAASGLVPERPGSKRSVGADDSDLEGGRTPERGSTNGEVMVTGAMTVLALWSAYQDSKYILEGADTTERAGRTVEVTGGYGGMAAGAALGAKLCAIGGPEAALFCGLLGGAIGSGAGRMIARGTWNAVSGLPDFIMPGPAKSINNDPSVIEFDTLVNSGGYNPVYNW
jgi:RHS repeat-associated protein